ncbi:DUF3939 domain-containing protein [Paenibacillus sp. ACRRX]|uniref:DUF3939 domain-containing protein n=1 Tax=unclassified Paenibacillus TaxID=185978 RepID=UPI001EF48D9C|nr:MULTISPECIES: DUF3939 domain-containing protein [unclassified Paenibacillus]MCG7407380.1 DUF3939 domain-containing protein [Paenibacillus sp. ACRRX]MDK8180606.1 DUF3939 domain-containing protein [Paenibacillus sp. UMB4589-SE434]
MKWLTNWYRSVVKAKNKNYEYEEVVVTLKDVKRAMLAWEHDMPEQMIRTQLLREDQSIDLYRLRRYLGGISNQKFYMSRFTYQIFEEQDKHIPRYLDMVQAAVDDYMDENTQLPVVNGTRNRQVHYDKLIQGHYLNELPNIPLYVTTEEFLLTHDSDWHQSYVN